MQPSATSSTSTRARVLVKRIRLVRVRDLSPSERETLGPALAAIVRQSFKTTDDFIVQEGVIFRGENATLRLFYGDDDRLLGFQSFEFVNFDVGGRTHTVVDAGAYMVPGVKGIGRSILRFSLSQVVKFKLRHPSASLCYVGEVTSPVPYRRAMALPLVYPRRGSDIPSWTTDLVSQVMRVRGMLQVGNDPWRVSLPERVPIRRDEAIAHVAERDGANDPDVAYFVRRNPDYRAGDWLVMYVGYDWKHLCATALPFLKRWVGNTCFDSHGHLAAVGET